MKYVITGLILFASLAALSLLVMTNSGLLEDWDLKLFEKINNPHGGILDKIMIALTKYGREFVWIGIVAILFILGKKDSSFPSGHATIVSAGAFILLTRFNQGKRIIFSLVLAAEAILVMYSRVYVGNHYPLDVLGGIFLGIGVAAIVIACSRFLEPIFSRTDKIGRQ